MEPPTCLPEARHGKAHTSCHVQIFVDNSSASVPEVNTPIRNFHMKSNFFLCWELSGSLVLFPKRKEGKMLIVLFITTFFILKDYVNMSCLSLLFSRQNKSSSFTFSSRSYFLNLQFLLCYELSCQKNCFIIVTRSQVE